MTCLCPGFASTHLGTFAQLLARRRSKRRWRARRLGGEGLRETLDGVLGSAIRAEARRGDHASDARDLTICRSSARACAEDLSRRAPQDRRISTEEVWHATQG